jgi:hypothetical protein
VWSYVHNPGAMLLFSPVHAIAELEIGARAWIFWVAVQHDPLPGPFNASAIFGGKWNITLRGRFSGKVLEGSIFNNGDKTFTVTATLRLQKGGNGDVSSLGSAQPRRFPTDS